MNNTDSTNISSWERIQNGVRETERLIGQKKYNLAMVKARQTLEFMVKSLCEKSGITEGGLLDMIDALYAEGEISKITCEHYHKIRTIGNKAIHEEDNSAYNANQAHHLLSQEVYTFANDYTDRRKKSSPTRRPAPDSSRSQTRESIRRSRDSRRRRAYSSGPSIELGSILKPLLLIAIIIVLLFIIKMIRPAQETPVESTTPSVTAESMDSSESPTDEEAESGSSAVMYRTTDTLNVRSTPSTDTDRIGVLGPDTEVEYVDDYDEKWCIIRYNGQDAYVAKEFLEPVS